MYCTVLSALQAAAVCSDSVFTGLFLLQSSNNGQIGIAQNHCSSNTISGNTCTSNMQEGITADNQANGAQVNITHVHILTRRHASLHATLDLCVVRHGQSIHMYVTCHELASSCLRTTCLALRHADACMPKSVSEKFSKLTAQVLDAALASYHVVAGRAFGCL